MARFFVSSTLVGVQFLKRENPCLVHRDHLRIYSYIFNRISSKKYEYAVFVASIEERF
jgi:hypothetical protein